MARSVNNKNGTAIYVAAALLTLFCLWELDGLWNADLRYPIVPIEGDVLGTQAVFFKGMLDNPWFLNNKWLGAPFGANFADIPNPDLLLQVVCKLLALVTKNHMLTRNLMAISSYPLVALTALYVMRRLGVRDLIAVVAGVIYAFIPFHWLRISGHFALGVGYFSIPLATLLALGLFENSRLFLDTAPESSKLRALGGRRTWVAIAWCVAMGTSGLVYFSAFSCFLFMLAGLLASLRLHSKLPLLRGTCMSFITVASTLVGLLPYLWNNWQHGSVVTLLRLPKDAEVFGLKIIQLLVPGTVHRLPALQRFSDYYARVAPLVTENRIAYLGAVGAAGFLFLIFVLLRGESRDPRLRSLSVFNIAMVLLGTIGGFSSLIAFFATDMLRSYNRISVYIAFFSLLALALSAERFAKKWVSSRKREFIMCVMLFGVLVFALWDQHLVGMDYPDQKKGYDEHAGFIARIEQSVPLGSSIFEYPYAPIPEHGRIEKLEDSSEFMPYLHSKSLRWSAGAVKNRRGDAWSANIAGMPPDQAVDALVQTGFSGIYLARDGYADHGKAFEAALKPLLGRPTVVSRRGDAAFYSLVERSNRMHADLGEKEFERRKQQALTPLYLGWLAGCYARESHSPGPRIWCKSKGRLVIDNPSNTPIHAALEAKLTAAEPPVKVSFHSDLLNHAVYVSDRPYDLSEGFDVPPGEHIITFTTSGPGKLDDSLRDIYVAFDDPHLGSVVRSSTFDYGPAH